ncbi:hypothetical protein [Bradyrhizobium mercantei]|nr:hypothetical protein [Bradyrhizobium mercantei]
MIRIEYDSIHPADKSFAVRQTQSYPLRTTGIATPAKRLEVFDGYRPPA